MLRKFKHLLPRLVTCAARSPMRFRHAAAIVDRGGVPLCFGYNRNERHAEMDALFKLRKLPWRDEAYAVVVIRVSPSGLAESKPCISCANAIRLFGLKVFHSERNQSA